MQYFLLLPLWYQYALVACFGLIIGSFLNVYIYRYHTGRSLSGHSHCMSCGTPLTWYELFPVLSYLALRGRCRTCGSYIPVRYALVEATTALLFMLFYARFGLTWSLPVALLLGTVLIVITVYDLYHMIIPNGLVLATGVLAIIAFVVRYPFDHRTVWVLASAILGAATASAFYGFLWVISQGRWIGLGDAKLAIPLGFMLGIGGIFSFITLSFWIGAVLSVALIGFLRLQQLLRQAWRRRTFPQHVIEKYPVSLTMKSEVPFAPFMIVAFLVVYLWHVDVLTAFQLFL